MNTATSVRLGPSGHVGEVAERLRVELERLGITAEAHAGDGVVLLSVWTDLVVWCEQGSDGWHYRWWTGCLADRTGRYIYTRSPAWAVKTAAHRIAERYAELRHLPSLRPVTERTCNDNSECRHG